MVHGEMLLHTEELNNIGYVELEHEKRSGIALIKISEYVRVITYHGHNPPVDNSQHRGALSLQFLSSQLLCLQVQIRCDIVGLAESNIFLRSGLIHLCIFVHNGYGSS